MGAIYDINPFLHPIRALKLAVRRWSLREDIKQTDSRTGDFEGYDDIPLGLRHFEKGEVLPWKGVKFKVGKVVGGDCPCVILVPVGPTHGAKLQTMRTFRDTARAERTDRSRTRAALRQEASR